MRHLLNRFAAWLLYKTTDFNRVHDLDLDGPDVPLENPYGLLDEHDG